MKLTYDEYLTKAEEVREKLIEVKLKASIKFLSVVDFLNCAKEFLDYISENCGFVFEESNLHHPEEVIGFDQLNDYETEYLYSLWDMLFNISDEYNSILNLANKFNKEISKMIGESNTLGVDK